MRQSAILVTFLKSHYGEQTSCHSVRIENGVGWYDAWEQI